MFKEGDCVWLNFKNISTPRPSKKLAWLHAKYRVLKIISPQVIELDVLIGIHPRFHVDLLKRAANNPLPSQKQDVNQPGPINTTGLMKDQEFKVERILKAENVRRGRGKRRMVLVKWYGQKEPTWEPRSEMQETVTLDKFEKKIWYR